MPSAHTSLLPGTNSHQPRNSYVICRHTPFQETATEECGALTKPSRSPQSYPLDHSESLLVKANGTVIPVDGKDVIKEYISTNDERERDPRP